MTSYSDLKRIVGRGQSARVDSQSFPAVKLAWLARHAGEHGGKLIIFNAGALKDIERDWIVRDSNGSVTFE